MEEGPEEDSQELIFYKQVEDPQPEPTSELPTLPKEQSAPNGRTTFKETLEHREKHVKIQVPFRLARVLIKGQLRLRIVDAQGNPVNIPVAEKRGEDIMEDSQGSMSPTQENEDSAYERHGIDVSMRRSMRKEPERSVWESPAKHSTGAESTGRTYEMNDTGVVDFRDYEPNTGSQDEPENGSLQTPSLPSHGYEPETPAPPINPFGNRGVVMNAKELFGATQPSSIGRQFLPSASSRPSPNEYDAFNSPVKQNLSSPLRYRRDHRVPQSDLETSPLLPSSQSVHNILQKQGMQSFRDENRQANSDEPRPYVSMEASQERRRRASDQESDSDNNSSEDEIEQRQREIQRRRKIQQELSHIEVPEVEVPSTGRKGRRSTSEEDIGRSDDFEPLETQNDGTDDVVTDSQALPTHSTGHVSNSQPDMSLPHPKTPAPSLPAPSDLIPETSPHIGSPVQQQSSLGLGIRPMGEVSSYVMDEETQDLDDVSGFLVVEDFSKLLDKTPEPSPVKAKPQKNMFVFQEPEPESESQPDAEPRDIHSEEADAQNEPAAPQDAKTTMNDVEMVDGPDNIMKPPGSAMSVEMLIQDPGHEDEPEESIEVDTSKSSNVVEKILNRKSPSKRGKGGKALKTYATPKRNVSTKKSVTKTKKMLGAPPSAAPPSSALSTSSTLTSLASVSPQMPTPSQPRRSGRNTSLQREITPATNSPDLPPTPSTKKPKRKSAAAARTREAAVPSRASRRQSTMTRESSADPIAGPTPSVSTGDQTSGLFNNMRFAVSFITEGTDKAEINDQITQQGGEVLENGFESLFKPGNGSLELTEAAATLGFTALIADQQSRSQKYFHALALGLPCIHNAWIKACIQKGQITDWVPYLLSSGEAKNTLGKGIFLSRRLQAYSATDALLANVFADRQVLLDGRAVIFVIGTPDTKRKSLKFTFLARALGPAKMEIVADLFKARKLLLDSDEGTWDAVLVDDTAEKTTAETSLFGEVSGSSSRKRKRGPEEVEMPAPKRIRIVNDHTILESLIMGSLLDENVRL